MEEERWLAQERDYRRQVRQSYYKREDDFESLEAYNDYLEDVEQLVANLIEPKTRADARKKLDQLRAENAEQTARNHKLLDAELRAVELRLANEKSQKLERAQARMRAEKEAEEKRVRIKATLQDKVSHGTAVADARAELTHEVVTAKHEPPPPAAAATVRYAPSAPSAAYAPREQPVARPADAMAAEARVADESKAYLVPSALQQLEAGEEDEEFLAKVCRAGGHDREGWRRRYREEAFDMGAWLVAAEIGSV